MDIDSKEKVEIYYRISDRLDWNLLGTVTAQTVIDNVNKRIDQSTTIPVIEQRYQFTKLPNLDALPEFNEIQFKFKLFNGMSLIKAWFEYDYITRNAVQ